MASTQQSQDDILVNLQEEYEKRQIQEVLDQLDTDLIGLVPVKTRIKEVAALLLVHRLRKALGLTSSNPGLHMSFTGSPGTGKTTVALKMADIFMSHNIKLFLYNFILRLTTVIINNKIISISFMK